MVAVDTGSLDQITIEFLNALKGDFSLVQKAAKSLFYYLVVFQLVWSGLWMSIAGESLRRFVTKIIQMAFSFGFFYTLILYGGDWIPDLINGFIHVGEQSGITGVDPSSVMAQGVSISGAIFKAFFNMGLLLHPFVSLVGAAVCVGIIILYALIAAELTVVLVKTYLIVCLGGIFFAFGGSDYTIEMAKNYFKTAIGLGLQLMTLYLVLGVGQNIGHSWAEITSKAATNHELMPMLVIGGAVIVYYLIVKNTPAFVAGIAGVSGFRNYGDAAVAMAVNAGMTTSSVMAKAATLSGRGAQGLHQGGNAVSQGYQAAQANHAKHGGGTFSKFGHGSSRIAIAGGKAVGDMVARKSQDMTFGQKLNSHLSNHINNLKK